MINTIVYKRPEKCPNCDSKNIGMDHISYSDSLDVTEDDWTCEDCGTSWGPIISHITKQ